MNNATALALPAVGFLDELMPPLERATFGFLAGCANPKTYAAYKHELQVFFDWCTVQKLPPLQARRPHLELYLRTLQASALAQSTVQRRIGVVGLFYRFAVIDEIIDKDPTVALKRPKIDYARQRRVHLTPLEMARYLEAARAEGPMALALAVLLGECALRISEACSLDVDSIVQINGWDVVRFVGKGDKYAEIPLPVPVMRIVQAAIAGRTSGPILLNQWGLRLDRKCAHRQIKKVAEAAGIRTDISPHSFRRTFITTALQMGIPLHRVQKAARHADPKTTLLYDLSNALENNATHQVAGFYSQWSG